MKRLLIFLVGMATVITGYAMYSKQDLGLMQVMFAQYSYQANLLEVGIGLLTLFLAFLLLSYAMQLLQKATVLFGEKRSQRVLAKARLSLEQGLIDLSEGRFAKAEKILLQKVEHNEHALLAYLAAARAAHYQGAYNRRDDYIRQAHNSAPDADLAIDLTLAKLQMDHDQFEQALVTLNRLNDLSPQHPYVLKLLAETHGKLANWDSLRALLPDVQKTGAISDEELFPLEIETWCGLISEHAKTDDIDTLTRLWDQVPRNIKTTSEVVEYYAGELIRLHASGEAEQVLRNYLNDNWVDSTIMLYAELDVMATDQQISRVESWLQDHTHNEYLLLALGKMCISKNDLGKARNYLEASLVVKPVPVTYLKLAQLLEDQLDDLHQAQEYYRQGLHMLSGDYGEAALANAANDFQRIIMQPELRVI